MEDNMNEKDSGDDIDGSMESESNEDEAADINFVDERVDGAAARP